MKLQSDISPLHHSLSQLSEKNGSLLADKRILEEDLKRWKAKTQVTCVFERERVNLKDRRKCYQCVISLYSFMLYFYIWCHSVLFEAGLDSTCQTVLVSHEPVCLYPLQQLLSQQKDGDVEERQKLTNEREAQQKRITQLVEEMAKLKTELARWTHTDPAQFLKLLLRDLRQT